MAMLNNQMVIVPLPFVTLIQTGQSLRGLQQDGHEFLQETGSLQATIQSGSNHRTANDARPVVVERLRSTRLG
jgi:hypothetical protein